MRPGLMLIIVSSWFQICWKVNDGSVQSHWFFVLLLKVLKVQVRAEERDDPRKLAKAHLESCKPGCLPLDRVMSCQLVFHDIKTEKAYLPSLWVTLTRQRESPYCVIDTRFRVVSTGRSSGLKINLIQLKRDKKQLLFLFPSFLGAKNRMEGPRLSRTSNSTAWTPTEPQLRSHANEHAIKH